MMDRNLLFFEEDLDDQLRARQQQVTGAVDGIPQEQFLISGDAELIEHIAARLTVEPLVLREDAITMSQNETQVDVSGNSRRVFSPGRSGPFYIPGTRVDVYIPFTGEDWIFRYRTNPWSPVFPRADVEKGRLHLSISLPHDAEPSSFKSTYEREFQLIKEYVESSHKQVIEYNESLSRLAQQAINSRRDRLGRHSNIAALLDIEVVPENWTGG